jgi:hypothetical protein
VLTKPLDLGAMRARDRIVSPPRLTAYAWWWLATRVALPLVTGCLLADLALG